MNDNLRREDQLIAGLSHAGVLLPVIGVAIPLGVWLSQRERSPLLRFQALQAGIYQVLGLLAYFLLIGCQFFGSFATFPAMFIPIAFVEEGSPETGGAAAIFTIVIMLLLGVISMLFNLVLCIGGPLYLIVGVWAARQVLQGRDFRYPLLGDVIERRVDA